MLREPNPRRPNARLDTAFVASVVVASLAWSASPCAAQSAPGSAYALVVGSDVGGPGQEPLRYAESDATRVRDALVSVSGYDAARVTLLRHPRLADVERSLATVRARIADHRRRGEPTQFVFYYSGHARSQGLHLASEELRLARLRELVAGVSADFTLVVLDACQSGAYARARGVEPASDFSVNSVAVLRTRGLASMTSSSDDELSQESEGLRGGFFTHHLVVGLRGAADTDHDGRVTLDELYAYAYAHTLSDTSRTAIGGQHVSLETDLVGQGGVPLAFPGRANAHLVLPNALVGTVVVEHLRPLAIVAEVQKVQGDEVRLALSVGRYRVVVRGARTLHECAVTLRAATATAVDLGECEARDPARDARSRGAPTTSVHAPWGFELGMGLAFVRDDAYVERLQEFGFHEPIDFGLTTGIGSFVVERRLPRSTSLVLRGRSFDHPYSTRRANSAVPGSTAEDRFWFSAFGLALGVRASALFADERFGLYGELSAGLGIGVTRFRAVDGPREVDTLLGYTIGAAAGLRYMPWERFGIFTELGFDYAPIVSNLLDETHDSGGGRILVGFRAEVRP